MRSIIGAFLLLTLLLCLVGCTDKNAGSGMQASEIIPEHVAPTRPENPGNDLIEYDPDRDIYFTCYNYDYDIYPNTNMPTFSFNIISTTSLNTEDIGLDLPTQSTVQHFMVIEEPILPEINERDSISPYAFPFYLYECYLGLDWEAEAAREYFRTYEDPLYLSYELLTAEDFPQFYVYFVEVMFDLNNLADEVLREANLTIGDETYHLDFGEVRIHTEVPTDYPSGWLTHANKSLIWMTGNIFPYNDGLLMPQLLDFKVLEDMELLELKVSGNRELLDIIVKVQSADEQYNEFFWNGEGGIYLYAGDHVSVFAVIRDPEFAMLRYRGDILAQLNYKCGDIYGTLAHDSTLFPAIDLYTTYAIVFDGLDMESYYRDYFYPTYESWREAYTQ